MNIRLKIVTLISITLVLAAITAAQNKMNDQADFDKTFSHQTADANGVRMHYVAGGAGEALVLIHGFTQTWHSYKRIMPALARKYTVIAPDLRGLGDSARPASGYDKATLAEDIFRLVEKLGYKQIYLVGHDEGGQVAYALAAKHPDLVRKLVFYEAGLPGISVQKEEAWHDAFQRVSDLPETLVAGREREYLTWFYRNLSFDKKAITEQDIAEYVRTYSQPGAMRAGFEIYRAKPQNVRLFQELSKRKLKMPILALGGDAASGEVPLDTMRRVATDVRGGVIKNCGHYVAEEQPEILTAQILDFFGEKKRADKKLFEEKR